MSYHRPLGLLDPSPTQLFAQAVDPYAFRAHPDAVYSPYGWGPDFTYGMPFNYTHHAGYFQTYTPRQP
jgi:hypothetical protein